MRFNKRLGAVACSMALVGGLAVTAAVPAGAALPKVDVANHSATCNDIIGKIKFGIPLTLGGTTPNSITITVKSTDCVDNTVGAYDANTNPGGVTLKQYVAKGILNSTTNDCAGLQGLSTGTTGPVIGKFIVVAGTPGLVNGFSTMTVSQTYGGTFNDGGVTSPASDSDSWGAQYGMFRVGVAAGTTAPTMTGAYNNGGGANMLFDGTTAQSVGSAATACFTTGIKGLQFGIGGFTT